MRILQINKFLKIVGGAETYMFQLAKALQSDGHVVKFWGMKDDDNITTDFPNLLANNVDYSNQGLVGKITSAIDTIYSKSNRKKIAQVLDEFQPEIVHLHNYNFQLTPSILPEIKKRGIKVVQTAHDSQMVCPYHRLFNFQKNTICTKCVEGSFTNCIKDKCFDGSLLKSTIGTFESYYYHKFDYYNKFIDEIISPSNFLADLLKKRIKTKITVIPNFTNAPNITETLIKKDHFLYVGRISNEKGIIELAEKCDFLKIKLVIIGSGAEEDKLIKSNYIKFLGPKYGNELFKYISEAKFVIQPSKGYESFGLLPIESFSVSTPVIVANHSGFKETVIDGYNGFLVDFKSNRIDAKLLDYYSMDTLNLEMNALKTYNTKFTKDIHIKKILKIYTTLATNNL